MISPLYSELYKAIANQEFDIIYDIINKHDINDTTFFTVVHRCVGEKRFDFIDYYIKSEINIPKYNTIILTLCCEYNHLTDIDTLLQKDFNFMLHQCTLYHWLLINNLWKIGKKVIKHKSFNIQDEVNQKEYSFFATISRCKDKRFNNIALELAQQYSCYREGIEDFQSEIIYGENEDLLKKLKINLNVEIDLSEEYGIIYHLMEVKGFKFLKFLLENTNVDPSVDSNEPMVEAMSNNDIKSINLLKKHKIVQSTLQRDHPGIFDEVYVS